jgi:hypothetical protein
VRGGEEGHEDHAEGVGGRAVEGVEELGVGEAVVGLVALLVEPQLGPQQVVHLRGREEDEEEEEEDNDGDDDDDDDDG